MRWLKNLDNLSTRLNYRGGRTAESRFQTDKLQTLKKALLYSYQGAFVKKYRLLFSINYLFFSDFEF